MYVATALFLGLLTFNNAKVEAQNSAQSRVDSIQKIEDSWKEEVDEQLVKLGKLEKLKISGYVHAQFELAEQYGKTKTGSPSTYDPARDYSSGDFYRIGLRRSRVKVTWEEAFGTAVFQIDLTEKGFRMRDAYVRVSEPWLDMFSLTVGIFDRPFGDEITYSSSKRETPERSKIYPELMPNEREVGAKLVVAAPKKSNLYGLKFEAAAVGGNTITAFNRSAVDFIGHLKYDKKWKKVALGVGASMYYGTVNNVDTMYYTIQEVPDLGKQWVGTAVAANSDLIRQYYGVETQFSVKTGWGVSQIRGEYLFGDQPSLVNDFTSPEGDVTFDAEDPYNHLRSFKGGHVYLVQDVCKTGVKAVAKYGYYDPNTLLKNNEVTNKADITYHSLGFGLVYDITSYIRVMAYYEMNYNERTEGIDVKTYENPELQSQDFNTNLKDNLFTLRLQFKY